MLSGAKECGTIYVQIFDPDFKALREAEKAAFCGKRSPFHFYSESSNIKIGIVKKYYYEQLSFFNCTYYVIDKGIITSLKNGLSFDQLGKFVNSGVTLILQYPTFKITSGEIHTFLVHDKKYKILQIILFQHQGKVMAFDGPSSKNNIIYNSQSSLLNTTLKSKSFQLFVVVYKMVEAKGFVYFAMKLNSKPKDQILVKYQNNTINFDDTKSHKVSSITHIVYSISSQPFVKITWWNFSYNGPNIGSCSFGGIAIYDKYENVSVHTIIHLILNWILNLYN